MSLLRSKHRKRTRTAQPPTATATVTLSVDMINVVNHIQRDRNAGLEYVIVRLPDLTVEQPAGPLTAVL